MKFLLLHLFIFTLIHSQDILPAYYREFLRQSCERDESKSPYGPGRCVKNNDCQGERTCSIQNYCIGDANCDRYDPCKVVEKPGGKCSSSEECRGKRSCTIGLVCVGETLCESDIRLEEFPCERVEREYGLCDNNKQCQGARKCMKGNCTGDSGCVKVDKKCLINEEFN